MALGRGWPLAPTVLTPLAAALGDRPQAIAVLWGALGELGGREGVGAPRALPSTPLPGWPCPQLTARVGAGSRWTGRRSARGPLGPVQVALADYGPAAGARVGRGPRFP